MKLLSPIVWITALAAALRLWGLGSESLWYDESFTAMLVHGSFGDIFSTLVARDAHPPLYYACLWPWVRAFGDGEAALRAFSALVGIASIPILYRVAARTISPRAGALAALLLAVSPFHVYYSQEARAYALAIFLALISLDLATSNPMTRAKWLGLGVVTALLVYTHYLTIFFVVAECLWVAIAFRKDRAFLLRWCGAMALGAALFAPWARVAYDHVRWVQSDFWIRPVTAQTVALSMDEILVRAYGPYVPREIGAVLPLAWLAAFIVAAIVAARDRALWLGFIVFFVPIALEILWSIRRPIFYTRTFGYVLPAAILLAALAFDRLRNRPAAWALAGALALSAVPGLLYIHLRNEKEDWRGLVARVRASAGPRDVIVLYPLTPLNAFRCAFDYYARGWTPPRVIELPEGRVDREWVRGQVARAPTVYLILRYGNGRLDMGLLAELSQGRRRAEAESHGPLLLEYSQEER